MEKKQKGILVVTLIALLLIFGGVTYAFFTADISGKETASTLIVTGGRLEIKYDNLSNVITMENIYPREEAWVTKTFTVTGTNTTDLDMNYRVGLEVLSSGFNAGDLTYSITGSGTGKTVSASNKDIPASGTIWFGNGSFDNGTGVVHSYTLTIYYPDKNVNQNSEQEKKFNAKVVIEEAGTTSEIADANACTVYKIDSYDINYDNCVAALSEKFSGIPNEALDNMCINGEDSGTTLETLITNTEYGLGLTLEQAEEHGIINTHKSEAELYQGLEYVNGQYTYGYKCHMFEQAQAGVRSGVLWTCNIEEDGWGVEV